MEENDVETTRINIDQLDLFNSPAFNELVATFSKRIGLDTTLSKKTILAIYDQCIYENALEGKSIFCTMFNEYELKVMEYFIDLSLFSKTQQEPRFVHSACKLTQDLHDHFEGIIKTKEFNARATTYFTHDYFISNLIGYLGVYRPPYSEDTIETHKIKGNAIIVDDRRSFRSSVLTPFNGNFGATLYKCHDDQYKILTTIQEVPQRIRGCKSALCDWDDFVHEYSQDFEDCDLEEICSS